MQKQYASVRKDVENLLQQSKDLEKSNFRLIQTNETLKAQMELQVRSSISSLISEELWCVCCRGEIWSHSIRYY